jgi:long-chain fatty acid transport protein
MSLRNCAALLAFSAVAVVAGSGAAVASGYALREQSGSLLGQAFAGENAYAADPSIIFFNPAGMSALDGTRVSVGASFIFPNIEFNNDGSTTALGPNILGTDEGGDIGENALVPSVYAMTSFGDFRIGIGVNSPFGLSTEYEDGSIPRFAALDSSLRTINVNPVVSYRVAPWLALGVGAQIQRTDARLTNAAFFGAPGEGDVELQADDVGYGFTAGALITPRAGTQIGIGFRSSVNHTLDGDVKINPPVGGSVKLDASADLDTPESLGVSLSQQVTDRLSLSGTVEWTNWSRFDELRVEFDTPGRPDSVTEEQWNDTYFFSLGADYKLTDKFTVRGGVAYDQSPVSDKFRTARLPDEDRYWIAIGGTYAVTDAISIDAGYTHIFVKNASVNEGFNVTPDGTVTGTLHGDYDEGIDIFGIQVNIRI